MKKKALKYLLRLILILLVFFAIYNLVNYIQTGELRITIASNNKYYTDSKLEASVQISSQKIIKKGKVNVQLLDAEEKKVKGVKGTYELDDDQIANISLDIPDDLQSGNYSLKIVANTNAGKNEVKKSILIENNNGSNINVTLDKGIYKPGDEVKFRVLITNKENDIPVEDEVKVNIYDGNDNRVYVLNSKTSDYGIIAGNFKLASEVNSGTYKLEVNIKGQQFSKYFTVNPYVTPKYSAKITTDKNNYLIGDVAKVTIKADYFFGETVKDANVEVKINDTTFSGKTNEEGECSFDYKTTETGNVSVSATVVDTSNYMVEEKYSFAVGTDLFEIEALPEYGAIVRGISNDIYVFTKNADGTPVKAYLTVNNGKFSRQIITDDNGIGKMTVLSSDINSTESATIFDIKAIDMNNNEISKKITLSVVNNNGTLLSTDKQKYKQGENIKLSLNSATNSDNTVVVAKNDKVIKIITTSDENIDIDLGDTYGLIDLYTLNTKNNNYYYDYDYYDYSYSYSNNSSIKLNNKKTIFIKPDKELKINVTTDLEEYAPGDKADFVFNVKDENEVNVEAALLVSVLDEAVLNLASNDISIDNIKLALSDVEFSDDLDAATLYANIVDDKSEMALMGLLLKQDSGTKSVQNQTLYPENTKDTYLSRTILSVALLIGLGLIIGIVKSKKMRNIIVHLLAIITIFVILMTSLFEVTYDNLDLEENEIVVLYIIISLIFYILFFYKKKEYLAEFLLGYLSLVLIGFIGWLIVDEYFWDSESIIILLAIMFIPIIYTIITVRERNKGKEYKVKDFFGRLFKNETILLVSLLIFRTHFLIVCLILDYIYVNVIKKEKRIKDGRIEIEDGKIKLSFDVKTVISTLALVIITVVLIGMALFIYSISVGDNGVLLYSNNIQGTMESSPTTSSSNPLLNTYSADTFTDAAIGGKSSGSSVTGLFDEFTNFSSSIQYDSVQKSVNSYETEEVTIDNTDDSKVDEKIRNVFLESLCFIPDLIAKNGNVTQSIDLSDNITTWQIQVVGNTKDGKVGYGSNSFRVFKEFFVDFSLPTNSVVGDKVSIPVTVYNYTDNELTVNLNIKAEEWFATANDQITVTVGAKNTKLVYLPIEILSSGENKLRVEAKTDKLTDIIERVMTTEENGIKISNVVSSGTFEDKLDLDVLYLNKYKEGTGKLKVKLYSTAMSQTIEGLENIFRMPTGCFEQVSSSLFPDILVLEYLEGKNVNEDIKQKALNYIETGYQKLLTYEVPGTKGGYSLYGYSPAELVLTSYGLMEIKELSSVYEVEDKVIDNMKNYIFGKQNLDGSFDIGDKSTYAISHIVNNSNELTLNAYVIWALSECFPEEKKLEQSISYLERHLDDVNDNYTLALMANAFANTKNKNSNAVIKKLMKNLDQNNNYTYLKSDVRDYYGTYGSGQNLQTTALTSLALTKTNSNSKTNAELINYIISKKDPYGTWGSTQATILSLRALVEFEGNKTVKEQDIEIKLNEDSRKISVEKDNLDIYQENFVNVEKENRLSLKLEKGKMYYEVIQEYYIDYEDYNADDNKLDVSYTIDQDATVNDTIVQKIKIANTSDGSILNGMVEISVPQGCSTKEESLGKLVANNIIEKYEYSYGKIYLYLRSFDKNEYKDIEIEYKADYPAEINGASVRVYDYYNPDVQGIAMPSKITIK